MKRPVYFCNYKNLSESHLKVENNNKLMKILK